MRAGDSADARQSGKTGADSGTCEFGPADTPELLTPEEVEEANRAPVGMPDEGAVPVADRLGNYRGTVLVSDFVFKPRFPGDHPPDDPLRVPVSDDSGRVVGYMIVRYGFLDAASAHDGATLHAVSTSPSSVVVDSNGEIVNATEWEARKRAGTACVR